MLNRLGFFLDILRMHSFTQTLLKLLQLNFLNHLYLEEYVIIQRKHSTLLQEKVHDTRLCNLSLGKQLALRINGLQWAMQCIHHLNKIVQIHFLIYSFNCWPETWFISLLAETKTWAYWWYLLFVLNLNFVFSEWSWKANHWSAYARYC